MVVAGFAALSISCGKATISSEQNHAELTSPTPTNSDVRYDEVTKPSVSPIQPNETVGVPPQVGSFGDKTQAENQLSVALAQYPVADEETRTNIVEHLAELVDKGADTADVAKALGSMFTMEKSAAVKVSILDELDGLAPPSLREQVMPALLPDQPPEVRDEAVAILKDLGDKRAIPALQTLLADHDDDLREEAQDAINALNSQP
jgi:hypothetical protein